MLLDNILAVYLKHLFKLLISLTCIVIIPVSVLVGKVQEYVPKKTLVVFGILCFIIGGTAPAFVSSFTAILVFRAILGLAIGILMPLSSALVVEYFEGDEVPKVMGQQVSAQMLGCAVMVLLGGYLAVMGWNMTFYVHLIAVISIIIVLTFLPNTKPIRSTAVEGAPAGNVKLTGAAYGWIFTMFLFFISAQVLSVFISFFIAFQKLGTPAQAGQTLTFLAIGGFIMGLVFGKLMTATKNLTLSVGLILMGVSYLLCVSAPNIIMVYLGSFVCGLSLSIVMPCIVVGASQSVDAI